MTIIEKPLLIWLFMFSAGAMMVVGQYVVGDVFGITLRNADGDEVKSSLLGVLNMDAINSITESIVDAPGQANSTLDAVTRAFELGLTVGGDLLLLLTGTYIFSIIYVMGGPQTIPIIGVFLVVYVVMLGRSIIAYFRGV